MRVSDELVAGDEACPERGEFTILASRGGILAGGLGPTERRPC